MPTISTNESKGEYILWFVDTFSKLIKGKYIKNKLPETIIEGIISTWIAGDGTGPGHPTSGFYADNGGEFLNQEVLDFAAAMDVHIKMTAANSPWQNGIVERHHATADVIFQKLIIENPDMDPQEAVNYAAFAKNSEVNKSRFSALQLMFGQSPHFPGLAESNPASSNLKSTSKYMRKLKNLDKIRVKFRETECDQKLKKVMSERLNPNVEKSYEIGDPIFFYDDKKKEWKQGTALVRLGKTLYLKFGNFLRRVSVDKCRPDPNGELSKEESYLEPDEDEERFVQEEISVTEIAPELELAARNKQLQAKVEMLESQLRNASSIAEEATETAPDAMDVVISEDNNVEEEDTGDKSGDRSLSVQEKRHVKRQRQKERKSQSLVKELPKLHQKILFKVTGHSFASRQ